MRSEEHSYYSQDSRSEYYSDDDDNDNLFGDLSVVKGIVMLFVGGMCVAAGTFLVLMSVFGGTRPPDPGFSEDFLDEPVDPQAPPPKKFDPDRPGHKFWWKAKKAFDWADKKATALAQRRKAEKMEKAAEGMQKRGAVPMEDNQHLLQGHKGGKLVAQKKTDWDADMTDGPPLYVPPSKMRKDD